MFLSFSSLALATLAHAASCCGGGFAAPSLIAGDDAASLTASYAYARTVSDVGSDALWRRRRAPENAETLKLEGAHVFADRWQAGLAVPVVRRSRSEVSAAGLGDVAATLAFEALPDWDYHPWRPKGLAFLQLTAPTGRAAGEATALYQLDSRGRGFWAFGAGALLTKAFGASDVFTTAEAHRSLAKGMPGGSLEPGWGGTGGGGAGWSFRDFRVGASLTWTYEDPVDATGSTASRGAPQRFATGSFAASWLASRAWAVTLAWNDQTLFGSPLNTSLGRGAVLQLQRRWAR